MHVEVMTSRDDIDETLMRTLWNTSERRRRGSSLSARKPLFMKTSACRFVPGSDAVETEAPTVPSDMLDTLGPGETLHMRIELSVDGGKTYVASQFCVLHCLPTQRRACLPP